MQFALKCELSTSHHSNIGDRTSCCLTETKLLTIIEVAIARANSLRKQTAVKIKQYTVDSTRNILDRTAGDSASTT